MENHFATFAPVPCEPWAIDRNLPLGAAWADYGWEYVNDFTLQLVMLIVNTCNKLTGRDKNNNNDITKKIDKNTCQIISLNLE